MNNLTAGLEALTLSDQVPDRHPEWNQKSLPERGSQRHTGCHPDLGRYQGQASHLLAQREAVRAIGGCV